MKKDKISLDCKSCAESYGADDEIPFVTAECMKAHVACGCRCLYYNKLKKDRWVLMVISKAKGKKPTECKKIADLFIAGCPVCLSEVNCKMAYCSNCGQKLDWSIENE